MPGHCVLASGGLDSAHVLHSVATECERPVHPVYVRFGLLWEPAEIEHLERLVDGLGGVRPVAVLDCPVDDVYDGHWAVEGPVPDADSPDAAVEIPGRNVLLLAKAGLYAAAEELETVWHGTLGRNPFPDATRSFFDGMAASLSEGYDRDVAVRTPLADAEKTEVIEELAAAEVPLEATFSCIDPVDGRHCGGCNKCAERRDAFEAAGVDDSTPYAEPPE